MNDISGWREVGSSIFRSPVHWFIHEQRYQRGAGFRHLFRTHYLIARSTGISTKREKVPDTIFMPQASKNCGLHLLRFPEIFFDPAP
jgi:hypothetical protein